MLRTILTFDTFVFPKIVVAIYWLGLLFIILATAGSVIILLQGHGVSTIFSPMQSVRGPAGIGIALIGGLVALIGWRLLIEFWLVIFSIRDLLRDIRNSGKSL